MWYLQDNTHVYRQNTRGEFWAAPCTYSAPVRPVDLHRCVITTIIIIIIILYYIIVLDVAEY